MSTPIDSSFGPVRQIGHVVRDAMSAIDGWLQLGVGPFFCFDRLTLRSVVYRGAETTIDIRVAMANSGPVQIEVIEPLTDAPSPFVDFLRSGREGVQHYACWTQDFRATVDRARRLGYDLCMDGTVESDGAAGGGLAYLTPGPVAGTMIEISDVSGRKGRVYRHVREASVGLNGDEPLRDLSSIRPITGR